MRLVNELLSAKSHMPTVSAAPPAICKIYELGCNISPFCFADFKAAAEGGERARPRHSARWRGDAAIPAAASRLFAIGKSFHPQIAPLPRAPVERTNVFTTPVARSPRERNARFGRAAARLMGHNSTDNSTDNSTYREIIAAGRICGLGFLFS